MGMSTKERVAGGCAFAPFLIWAYFVIAWIVNLVKLINCDFEAPYREEIIHGIGFISGFGAGITVWF